jgi:DNA polymerase III alpha subunit (gram-positive type)
MDEIDSRKDCTAVWSINSEKEEEPNMNEDKTTVIVSEDYTRAVTLTRNIIANAQAAQQSLYEVCKGLKEMRDGKLYKELGYQNFEDYTENEVGIGRAHAYRYLSIAENLTEDFVSSMRQIGTTKLALLAKLDEPTRETVTETVDVESVTVKELREQISRVESENADLGQKLDAANESLSSKSKQFKEAMDAKDKQLKAVKESGEQSLSECKAYLNGRIHDLEKRIHDMENAPIDHDMTDADAAEEIKRLKRQLEDEQLRFTVLEGDAAAKARRAAEEVRQEYEKKIAEMQSAQPAEQETPADTKAVFKAYLANAADSMSRLLTYLESIKTDANMPLYISKVDGIVEMTQSRRNAL